MAKAASHLAMSQSAVSEAIANLEDALRVRLLDRSSQGIEPTIYANALLKRGHAVFDELKQGIKDIEFLSDPTAGEVRIACPDFLSAWLLPAVIERLSCDHPQIHIRVVQHEATTWNFGSCRSATSILLSLEYPKCSRTTICWLGPLAGSSARDRALCVLSDSGRPRETEWQRQKSDNNANGEVGPQFLSLGQLSYKSRRTLDPSPNDL